MLVFIAQKRHVIACLHTHTVQHHLSKIKQFDTFDRQLTVHILVMAESIWTITFALSETTKKA